MYRATVSSLSLHNFRRPRIITTCNVTLIPKPYSIVAGTIYLAQTVSSYGSLSGYRSVYFKYGREVLTGGYAPWASPDVSSQEFRNSWWYVASYQSPLASWKRRIRSDAGTDTDIFEKHFSLILWKLFFISNAVFTAVFASRPRRRSFHSAYPFISARAKG